MIYGVSGGVCMAAFLCYKFVPANSVFQLLHYWNPVKFTQTDEIFKTYQNVNLFGYPVSLKITAVLIITAYIMLMISGCVFAVKRLRNVQYKSVRFNTLRSKKFRVHGCFYYICHRSLILNKGIVLALVAIIASAMLSASFSRRYNNDDIYYENFTTELSGQINSETLNFLKEKEEKYTETEKEIEKLQSSGNVNTYKLNLLYNKLNDRVAFDRLSKRVESIEVNGNRGEIFYDTGYERLFGYDGNNEKIIMILFAMIFLVLLLSPIAATDKKPIW